MRNASILIADDENTVLLTLKKMIKEEFQEVDVLLAKDGLDAWTQINNEPPSILITDISMPIIDGKQLLSKIRSQSEFDNIYIIILSANQDTNLINEMLDKGADDFIAKSTNHGTIRARIGAALRIVKLQSGLRNENELLQTLALELENDIQDLTMLAVKFMEARIPSSTTLLKKVAEASVWIAKEYQNYDHDTIRDIEIASYLSISGRIFLPDNLLYEPVMVNGIVINPLLSQIPIMGKEIIKSIKRFSSVAKYIYHLYENFDGTGIPSKLQSWQIPFPSRIIRVVLDYYEIRQRSSHSPEQILNTLKSNDKRLYDHRVVVLLDHYVRSVTKEIYNPNEKVLKIAELKAGMILTRDVITDAGLKLIPAGAKLTQRSVEMIINHNA